MLLSKRKLSDLYQLTSRPSIFLPYLRSKRPAVTWKTFGFALIHLTTSNFFGLPQTNIIPLLLLLRNASTSLLLAPPLQTLANFRIPLLLSESASYSCSSFTSFFSITITDVYYLFLIHNSQTAYSFEVFFYYLIVSY